MDKMGQPSSSRDRAQTRRARVVSRRAIVASLAIALLALTLAGCGGSSKPQLNLHPATVTGPLPTGTTIVKTKLAAKLNAFEYHTLKAVRTKIKAKQSLAATQPDQLAAVCRSVGHRTKLLQKEGQTCAQMIQFLSATLQVGKCFKALQTSGGTPGTPSYLSALYACDRSATPVAKQSKKLASDMLALISVARQRGFTGKCFNYLAGPSTPATDLVNLASLTNSMAKAGLSQNLTTAVTVTQSWATQLTKVSQELDKGPKSIKVCKHT